MTTAWRNSGLRFLALLISVDQSGKRERRLDKMMTQQYAFYTSQERRVATRWERVNRRLVWALAGSMTASQRQRLKQRVVGLVEDLEILARD
jgi:hypothetical protein